MPESPSENTPPLSGSSTNPQRSLLLLGLGAIAGLLLAAYGLFTASGTATNKLPEGALALVNQKQILLSDFNTQFMAEFDNSPGEGTAEQRKKVLGDMIREELLVQRGLEMDLPATDPDVRAALVEGVNVVNDAEQAAQTMTEETLRQYFTQHQASYMTFGTMQVRDMSLPAGEMVKAKAMVLALRQGQAWEKVRGKFPVTETKNEVDPVIKRSIGDVRYAVAVNMTPGEVSDPVVDGDTIHILMMVNRVPSTVSPFESVRQIVGRDIKAEALKKTSEQQLANLRAKSEIIVAPGYEK